MQRLWAGVVEVFLQILESILSFLSPLQCPATGKQNYVCEAQLRPLHEYTN